MKILYVLNNNMEYAGTESVVLNYFKYLNCDDMQIDFMLHTSEKECNENPICKRLKSQGSHIYCVTPRKVSIIQNYKDINHIFKTEHFDIVHSHADCVSGIILQIAKNAGIPVRIAHSHNTQSEVAGHFIKKYLHLFVLELCKINLRRVATHYMACSKEAGIWLFGSKIMRSGKVYILHNAIEYDKFKYNEEIRNRVRKELHLENTFVIGHVGRFCYQKNHKFLIDVFSEIKKEMSDSKLLLIGTGELKTSIEKYVSELNLNDSVIFYGNSNHVNELLQGMDVFAFPSHFEGLSVVLIEAQASGIPCIVADNNKISIESSISPLITRIKTDTPSLWVEKIITLRKMDRINTYQYVENACYNLPVEAKKLSQYYYECI